LRGRATARNDIACNDQLRIVTSHFKNLAVIIFTNVRGFRVRRVAAAAVGGYTGVVAVGVIEQGVLRKQAALLLYNHSEDDILWWKANQAFVQCATDSLWSNETLRRICF